MKRKQHKHFKSTKALAQFIEDGNAVIHSERRDTYGSLRELPPFVEEELHLFVPYDEEEAHRDQLRARKEREKEMRKNGFDQDDPFDPEI